jgi:hypothetical protein
MNPRSPWFCNADLGTIQSNASARPASINPHAWIGIELFPAPGVAMMSTTLVPDPAMISFFMVSNSDCIFLSIIKNPPGKPNFLFVYN